MSKFDNFGVTPIESMGIDEDAEEHQLLQDMLQRGIAFISNFRWCAEVKSTHFGMGVGKVFAVFLFEISNSALSQDDLLWVIIGDLPPAYLVTHDGAENPTEALEIYIGLMEEWVSAAQQGKPVNDLIPVNVPPTPEYAEKLRSRLQFLRERFLK
jgi:hypothetical protein